MPREASELDPAERTVVFVCLHGAAKSVIAAAYLRRLAGELGLDVGATSAGIDPEPEVPPKVAEALLKDGIDVRHVLPRRVTRAELMTAWRVVSFGCDLGHVAPLTLAVARWDDVPAVSDGFVAARDAIVARVRRLLEDAGGPRAAARAPRSPA